MPHKILPTLKSIPVHGSTEEKLKHRLEFALSHGMKHHAMLQLCTGKKKRVSSANVLGVLA